MNISSQPSHPTVGPSGGGSAASPPWRWNRERARWFLAAVALVVLASLWFCWRRPAGPVGPPRAGLLSWRGWLESVEVNAPGRLPLVPATKLNGCHFMDRQGWVVGDGGVILHTRDAGRTWQVQTNIVWGVEPAVTHPRQAAALRAVQEDMKVADAVTSARAQQGPVPDAKEPAVARPDYGTKGAGGEESGPVDALRTRRPQALHGVNFVDARQGWVVGAGGTVLHTTDGGESWTAQTVPTAEVLTAVAFVDAQRGSVVGSNGTLLDTGDGGVTWAVRPVGRSEWLTAVQRLDAQDAWAVGWSQAILHTGDGGRSWTNQSLAGGVGLESVAFVNAQVGWAVGAEGTILHTPDGGRTWSSQFSLRRLVLNGVAFVNAQLGWAVGSGGTILHTVDGGRTWAPQRSNVSDPLRAVCFSDARHGWAVGGEGVILRTEDGGHTWAACTANQSGAFATVVPGPRGSWWAVGEGGKVQFTTDAGRTWTTRSAGTDETLTSLAFPGSERGWLVGWNGTVRETRDGGVSWQERAVPTAEHCWAVTFRDSRRGWMVGDGGTILHTSDGGTTWTVQPTETARALLAATFADALRGWVVGDSGTVLRTVDGGQSWISQETPTKEDLRGVVFVGTELGWAAGRAGTILHTSDGGQTWEVQDPGTTADLYGIHFADAHAGWVVGEGGTVRRTTDGGRTWQAQGVETRASLVGVTFGAGGVGWVVGSGGTVLRSADGGRTWSDPRRYRWYPAPGYYLAVGAAGLLAWIGLYRSKGRADDPAVMPARSIADHAVSDRPLTSRDFDALHFGPLAQGIANFLRNEKTTGPLTLAVTGDWGSGKSSLMGLLKEGIEAKGFRPVWFNAWHHQQEEQLLAALLESIRQQAVPPWLSWAGCLFRARLIQERLRRQWVAMLLGAAAFAMLAAVVVNLGSDWQNWLGNLAASSWPVLAGKLAVLAGATAAAFKGWQGLKAFGVDPARLLASVTGKARLSDLGAQTSFRHRFAQEFRDVTTALHPRTMTIFVDDLDRCEPAQVMQVMQALNFLSSSGECFLIVGMEESAVTNCVAVSLKEQFDVRDGRTLDSEAKAQRRWDYARHWMEKLIQIRIPVPSPDDSQFKALLIGGPPPRSRTAWAGLWAEWRDRVQRIWERVRPLVVLGVATGVALASYFLVDSQLAGRADRQESAASRATPAGGAGSPEPGARPVAAEAKPGQAAAAAGDTRGPAFAEPQVAGRPGPLELTVRAGQKDPRAAWLAFGVVVALLVVGGQRLVEQLNRPVQDSEDFRQALARWSERIGRAHPTPRAAKRLINKLRFFAMVARALRAAGLRDDVPENALVAFGVLEGDPGGGAALADVSWAREGLEQDVAALRASLARHPDLFRYLRAVVRLGSADGPDLGPGHAQGITAGEPQRR